MKARSRIVSPSDGQVLAVAGNSTMIRLASIRNGSECPRPISSPANRTRVVVNEADPADAPQPFFDLFHTV